jgi:hypothetical protein
MKKPLPRGLQIDIARMSRWAADFSGYRSTVTEERIDRWLGQFAPNDRDLLARILDCVDFVTNEQMARAFKSALASLPGWHPSERRRQGKWRFVPYSGSTGESGDSMLHRFRIANGLGSKAHCELFIHKSELLLADLSSNDTVVFVDDFAGTGDQACEAWKSTFVELLPGQPSVFLVLVRSSTSARKRIQKESSLSVVADQELTEKDNVFSNQCPHFTSAERTVLLKYCHIADAKRPRGHGDCGYLLVFAHNCPNNTIPILHANHERWEGLFRRHE